MAKNQAADESGPEVEPEATEAEAEASEDESAESPQDEAAEQEPPRDMGSTIPAVVN